MTDYIRTMRKYIGHEMLQIVGASVYIHKGGKLLLQKRKDNGCWGCHGGCVELGEIIEDAARRELFEETGLTALSLEFLGVFSGEELFYTYPNGDMVSIVDIVYLCEEFTGDLMKETNETTDLKWFDIDNIPNNISPPNYQSLKKCIELLKARENF